jgi:hypothetical protein
MCTTSLGRVPVRRKETVLDKCLGKHELEEKKAKTKRKEPKIDGCLI